MQLLDSLLPMIELVEKPGADTANEKYITLPLGAPKPLFGIFKRGDPPKIYRVRNQKHPRGLAERRNLVLTVRDMKSDLTLNIEIGYRVACLPGQEANVAQKLAAETTPGEVFDQTVEGWIKEFARDTSGFFQSVGGFIEPMWASVETSANTFGLVLKVFLERAPVTRRTWSFSLPVPFRDQDEAVSVSFRLAVFHSQDEAAVNRSRLNETPSTLEQDAKRRIQEWFGASVLRDSVDRHTSVVAKDLKAHLDVWLFVFGLESFVEAIVAPPRSRPDVEHTVRVDGLVSLGHFQWQVRTTMEIDNPEKFLREKRERQITEIHIWLGEQYPEFCWDAVRKSGGDAGKFSFEFEKEVQSAVEAIGYKLKNSILRRVLSDVELDARKQYLDANLSQDKFLIRLIEGTQTKIVNAYDADDSQEEIERLEKRLKDLQTQRGTLIKEIAATRSDAKNLLPAATADAIGAERRTWTAIADGRAEAPQIEAPKRKAAAANGEDVVAATGE